MSTTATSTSSAAHLGPDTLLVGLVGIGTRLYDDWWAGEGDPEPGSIRDAEHAVFSHLFEQVWPHLGEEERGALRAHFNHFEEEFDRMLADQEARRAKRLLGMTLGEARAEVGTVGR